ncbi:MAG TPA: DUF72 domain-containing protein [Polyangiaceae bacterium]|nr:DUF72 domain-containing protein [Polyangiaceae bacterium]
MARDEEQPSLFELPPRTLEAAPEPAEHRALREQLAAGLRLGTMSWSFPGWRGSVYAESADPKLLSEAGLTAYSKHSLLGAVEIDRSFYEPLPARYFESVSAQVPHDFRFLVKAHEELTMPRFPKHPRYGKKQDTDSARFLDPIYASEAVVGPALAGLGEKLGAIVFQFSPQDASEPLRFAERLGRFLQGLPRAATYAVELRNPELLTPTYADALASAGAVHAHNVWGTMPPVLQQARLIPPVARKPLIVRWLMRRGDDYEGARSRFLPFSRLVEPDLNNRRDVATLIAKALAHQVPAFVVVNNKAEGSAPASIVELAKSIVASRV